MTAKEAPVSDSAVILDPEEAQRQKQQRIHRHNVVEIPSFRLVGFTLFCVGIIFHNHVIFPQFSLFTLLIVSTVILSYCVLSWFLLKMFFDRVKAFDLGFTFLVSDLFIFVLAIYFSGGDKSLFFFSLILRVADQTDTGFRRAFLFVHLAVFSYLAMLLYLNYFEHRSISWSVEMVKLFILYSAGLYVSLPAITIERIRWKTGSAIRLARESIIALKQEEDRYRDLVENSEDLIMTHDLEGKILSVNRAMLKRSGYTQEELLGRPLRDLTAPWMNKEYQEYLRCIREEDRAHGYMRLVTRSGEHKMLEFDNSVRTDGLEKPIVRARAFDVTDKIRAEQALRESEQRYRVLFESSLGFISTHDLDGTLLSINPAGAGALGYSPEELIGTNLAEHIAPDKRHLINEYLKDIQENHKSSGFIQLVTKDGSARVWEYLNCLYEEKGKRYIIGYAQDITERLRAVKMKEELISIVSHELRTPITSIKGSLDFLVDRMGSQLPEQAHKMIGIASRSSDRLVRLINDLLHLDKIESGKMEFRFQPLELLPLVQQTIEATQSYAEQWDVRFVLDAAVSDAKVNADSDRLVQVVTNLLSNAAKFSPQKTDVSVTITRRRDKVRVAVTDRGPGIPEEFQCRIFTKFAQANRAESRHKKGTGLGLSISKAIVERHGGQIGFETKIHEGTTFYFDLPELNPVTTVL